MASFKKTNGKSVSLKFMETHALYLNNLQTIPFKILDVTRKPSPSGGDQFFIEVEDYIDNKEWKMLCRAWSKGFEAGIESNDRKFDK